MLTSSVVGSGSVSGARSEVSTSRDKGSGAKDGGGRLSAFTTVRLLKEIDVDDSLIRRVVLVPAIDVSSFSRLVQRVNSFAIFLFRFLKVICQDIRLY